MPAPFVPSRPVRIVGVGSCLGAPIFGPAAGPRALRDRGALLQVLKQPNVGSEAHAAFAQPAPTEATACYKTFCGT